MAINWPSECEQSLGKLRTAIKRLSEDVRSVGVLGLIISRLSNCEPSFCRPGVPIDRCAGLAINGQAGNGDQLTERIWRLSGVL